MLLEKGTPYPAIGNTKRPICRSPAPDTPNPPAGPNRRAGTQLTGRTACATLSSVQSAFGTVVWVVCGVGILGALVAVLLNGRTWEDYGKNHLMLDTDDARGPTSPGAVRDERDTEIRQLLEARNARRRRRGLPEVDVERELAQLTAPAIDPELRQEIRDLVVARNHRRARQGKLPLDVEAEIEREIDGLRGV
jgi:hypothetical protein